MHIIEYSEFEKKSIFFMNNPSKFYYTFILVQIITIVFFFIWIFFFELDDSVKTSVLIRPNKNISIVYAIPGGEVININYCNNQLIHEGDILLLLDTKADNEDLSNSKKRLEQIDKDLYSYNELLEIIHKEENRIIQKSNITKLSENYINEDQRLLSIVETSKILLEREEKKPDNLKVLHTIEDLKRQFEQTELQYKKWKSEQEIKTNDYINQLLVEKNNILRRINDLERNIKNSTIKAPITGKINEIRKMNIGDTIVTGEKLFDIVPIETNELKAEIYLNPSVIAKIEEDQKVIISFPELPATRYGQLEGRITTIPPDYIITDGQILFKLDASLNTNYLEDKNGKKIYLHSGMTAQGRIIIGKDKIIYMILKKIGYMLR